MRIRIGILLLLVSCAGLLWMKRGVGHGDRNNDKVVHVKETLRILRVTSEMFYRDYGRWPRTQQELDAASASLVWLPSRSTQPARLCA